MEVRGQLLGANFLLPPSHGSWEAQVVRIVWQELTPAEPPHQPNIAYSTSLTILLQTDVLVCVCGVCMYICIYVYICIMIYSTSDY